jgi:hypothetical protein
VFHNISGYDICDFWVKISEMNCSAEMPWTAVKEAEKT